VRERDGQTDLLKDARETVEVVGRGLALLKHFGERPTLDELHGEERPPVGKRAEILNRRDTRVFEPRGDARLLDEPPLGVGAGQP
jgi:hypothetical protein